MYFNSKVHGYLSHYYFICLLVTSCLVINDLIFYSLICTAICHLISKFTANDDVIHNYVTICHLLAKYTASNDLIHTYVTICHLISMYTAINDLIHTYVTICHLISMYTAINDLIHKYVTICHLISMYTATLWPHLILSSDLTNLLPIYSDSSLCFAVIHFHYLNIISSLITNILIKSFNLHFIRQRTLQYNYKCLSQLFKTINFVIWPFEYS